MNKKILFSLLTSVFYLTSYGQLLDENFNYPLGQLTTNNSGANVSAGAWTFIGGALPLNVVAGNLTYPNYASSNIGNRLATRDTSAAAEDAYTSFTPVTSGSIYFSFLLNVVDTARLLDNALAGDYMIALLPSTSTTNYTNRITFRKGSVGNTFNIGLRITSTGSTVVVWSPNNYSPGVTYLIASQFVFITGPANDSAYLWINPVLNGTIPTPDVAAVQLGPSTDPIDIGRIAVRQSGGTPESFIDGIRVGTTWANSVLPVKLLSFTAQMKSGRNELFWATSNEVNNYGFEIQKSSDGDNFETIGFVKGAGNSSQIMNYSFVDENNTSAYYRLKQIDFDGEFEYSKIVALNQTEIDIALTPNPFSNSLVVSGSGNINSIEIIDGTGKTCAYQEVNGMQSTINTESLNSGVYLIRVSNDYTTVTKRIIKY
ncbi:MAG: T9SS type A sorting domain-containing protein [Bacteroidia bacterium]|jgi:hypothetical protein|nr:T9SS type A sorting domain-containing protein [Bacteroidia bacterium]